jgi:glutamyl-tRNA synthetase
MNGQYLSRTPAAELEPIVRPLVVAAGLATDAELTARRDWFRALIDLLKVRARTTHDIVAQAVPYLAPTIAYDPAAVQKVWKDADATAELLRAIRERLAALPSWDTERVEEALRAFGEERGLAAGKVFQPLRVALTGSAVSPGIFEVLTVMGRDLTLRRLDQALERLNDKH